MIDANPDVVHGKDNAEGIALWAKQTTFTSLRDMIPRGYDSIKDVPVVSLNCEVPEASDPAQRIRHYNEARQKASGFDPSCGKGDFMPSKSLPCMQVPGLSCIQAQSFVMSKGLNGEMHLPQPQPIKKFYSMAVKLGLRRVDSWTDLNEIKREEEENRSEDIPMKNWNLEDLLGEPQGSRGEIAKDGPADN